MHSLQSDIYAIEVSGRAAEKSNKQKTACVLSSDPLRLPLDLWFF